MLNVYVGFLNKFDKYYISYDIILNITLDIDVCYLLDIISYKYHMYK